MSSSLYSGLAGLRAYQQWIDVLGNNLANSNTTGFKSSRITFSETMAQTLSFAQAPTGGIGGIDPMQLGLGVKASSVDHNFGQGVLTDTGRTFDLALDGRGFFAVQNGATRYYSRAGAFGLDTSSNLVDQATGYHVLDRTGQAVKLDTQSLFPPRATADMVMVGNLPGVVTGPLAEVMTGASGLKQGAAAVLAASIAGPTYAVGAGTTYSMEILASGGAPQSVNVSDLDGDGLLTIAEIADAIDELDEINSFVNASGLIEIRSDRTGTDVSLKVLEGSVNDLSSLIGVSTALVLGSESAVTETTRLNDLPSNVTNYMAGDEIRISGVDTDGTAIEGSFVYGTDGETVSDLVAFADSLYADATVSLNASGQLVLQAQTPGEADLLLTIEDDTTNAGITAWSNYGLSVSTEGTGPDRVVTSSEAYDRAGVAHTITYTFERQSDLSWTMTAAVPPEDGSVVDGVVTGIRFAENGAPIGLAAVDATVTVRFIGQSTDQDISLNLGGDGRFDGLTQFGGSDGVFVASQNGYGEGELANIKVQYDGNIEAVYSNGQARSLGTVGIASFSNPDGLLDAGSNLWLETSNSGFINIGEGDSQIAGKLIGGALEGSNVDTAEQFVHLIEAQRGFQASARVISIQDEVLAEAVNLI